MNRYRLCIAMASILFISQSSHSLPSLDFSGSVGDEVELSLVDGKRISGKIARANESSLSLAIAETIKEIPISNISAANGRAVDIPAPAGSLMFRNDYAAGPDKGYVEFYGLRFHEISNGVIESPNTPAFIAAFMQMKSSMDIFRIEEGKEYSEGPLYFHATGEKWDRYRIAKPSGEYTFKIKTTRNNAVSDPILVKVKVTPGRITPVLIALNRRQALGLTHWFDFIGHAHEESIPLHSAPSDRPQFLRHLLDEDYYGNRLYGICYFSEFPEAVDDLVLDRLNEMTWNDDHPLIRTEAKKALKGILSGMKSGGAKEIKARLKNDQHAMRDRTSSAEKDIFWIDAPDLTRLSSWALTIPPDYGPVTGTSGPFIRLPSARDMDRNNGAVEFYVVTKKGEDPNHVFGISQLLGNEARFQGFTDGYGQVKPLFRVLRLESRPGTHRFSIFLSSTETVKEISVDVAPQSKTLVRLKGIKRKEVVNEEAEWVYEITSVSVSDKRLPRILNSQTLPLLLDATHSTDYLTRYYAVFYLGVAGRNANKDCVARLIELARSKDEKPIIKEATSSLKKIQKLSTDEEVLAIVGSFFLPSSNTTSTSKHTD